MSSNPFEQYASMARALSYPNYWRGEAGRYARLYEDSCEANKRLTVEVDNLRRQVRSQETLADLIVEKLMAANLKKTVKIDEKDGKKRVVRVRKFDASKARRIAKSKTQRIVSPAKARARNV